MTAARRRRSAVLIGDREFPIAEVIEAVAQRCIRAKPVAVMVAWELPSGKVVQVTIPPSAALMRGLAAKIAEG